MNRKVYVICKMYGSLDDVELLMVVDTEESAIETINKLVEIEIAKYPGASDEAEDFWSWQMDRPCGKMIFGGDVCFFYRELDYITSQNEK